MAKTVHRPGPGFMSETEQSAARIVRRLTHFDTARHELGINHKFGLRRTTRDFLAFPRPPLVFIEGMASVRGQASANQALSERRESTVEMFLLGLLQGRIPIEDDGGDGAEDAVDLLGFSVVTMPGFGQGRGLISNVAGFQPRPVVLFSGRAGGSAQHEQKIKDPTYKVDLNDGYFRAVGLSALTADQRRPPPPLPIDPSRPRALDFRIRIAADQPTQPKDINKLLSDALAIAKTTPKLAAVARRLERFTARFPRLAGGVGKAANLLKAVKYALSALGIMVVMLEIMDDQARRGGLYVYVGAGFSTDVIADVVLDLVVDSIADLLAAGTDSSTFGVALEAALTKLGLKDMASRIKKWAGLELVGPFPFTPFKAMTLPFAGIATVALEDFQGAAAMAREGTKLEITFIEGIGTRRPALTVPRFIPLRTSGKHSISQGMNFAGAISMGAPTPYVT